MRSAILILIMFLMGVSCNERSKNCSDEIFLVNRDEILYHFKKHSITSRDNYIQFEMMFDNSEKIICGFLNEGISAPDEIEFGGSLLDEEISLLKQNLYKDVEDQSLYVTKFKQYVFDKVKLLSRYHIHAMKSEFIKTSINIFYHCSGSMFYYVDDESLVNDAWRKSLNDKTNLGDGWYMKDD